MADTELNDGWPEMGHGYREQTRRRKEVIGGPETIASAVNVVLEYLEKVGLDLPMFLDAVCWGNDHLVADGRAKYQRSVLVYSDELPQILERLEKKSIQAKSAPKCHALSTIKTGIQT